MSNNELEQLLMPPKNKIPERSKDEWNKVENELGISLPIDYKKFISTYNSGCIDNFIWINNPFIENVNLNFFHQLRIIADSYIELKNQFPADFKYDVFPHEEGLLPFGSTDNGDILYWHINEDANKWSIVVYDDRHSEYQEYEGSMSEFLYKLLTKTLKCPIFPFGFPSNNPQFLIFH